MNAKTIAATLLLLCAPAAWAGDYATCILDKAPGVANEAAAAAVHQVCLEENPGGLQAVCRPGLRPRAVRLQVWRRVHREEGQRHP